MNERDEQNPTGTTKGMSAVVAAFRQSGLSLKQFARGHGMSPGRLHYWVYEKSREATPRPSVWKGRAVDRAAFQEVRFEAGTALLQSWAAEVNLPRVGNVRFSGAASPEWIGEVVQALQRPC